MQSLFQLLEAIQPMSDALKAHLAKILKRYQYEAGDMILTEGQICRHILFIIKGLMRVYHLHDGKEVPTWFLAENDIAISPSSFFGQKPSRDWIQAVEAVIAVGVTYADLEDTCVKFPEFNRHRIIITQNYYVKSEDKHHNRQSLNAEERYLALYNENPDLFERVPKKYLFAYLDMSQTTFYDIRNSIATRKGKNGHF